MRPMEFLLPAYLPERERNSTGSARISQGKIWESVGLNLGTSYLSTLTLLQKYLVFTLTLFQ